MADDETTNLAALHEKGSMHFYGNRLPLCPHCGVEFDISRHDRYDLYDDNDRHEVTCPSCDRDFLVHTHASYAFSTDEQGDD